MLFMFILTAIADFLPSGPGGPNGPDDERYARITIQDQSRDRDR